jgi:hypothetical protein
MNATKKFWIVLTGTVLAMVMIACSCNSLTPALNPTATAAVIPQPATEIVPPAETIVSNPLPDLAGFWQDFSRVFTIEWQGNQYVVSAITAAGTSKRTLTSQSWDGKSLTWTYEYSDENGSSTNTYTTVSVSGDSLTVKYSSTNGAADTHTLKRVSSAVPVHDALPYYEDFSNPNSGWDIYSNDNSSAGYENGYYFVSAKKVKINYYGEACSRTVTVIYSRSRGMGISRWEFTPAAGTLIARFYLETIGSDPPPSRQARRPIISA